jgi:hypothetical protein
MNRRDFILGTVSLTACSGPSTITGIAEMGGSRGIVPTGGVPAGSQFFADPYSSYPTRLVDGTIASDVVGGTTLTRNSGFGNGSFQVYKTIEFGISDWLTASPRRLGVLNTTTYAPASYAPVPNAGSSDVSRVVIQGDPALVPGSIPQIVWPDNAGLIIGGDIDVISYVGHACPWVTVRKLDMSGANFLADVWAGYGNHDTTGMIVEFCNIHDGVGTVNNTGGIRIDLNPTVANAPIIRYNKLYNFNKSGGVRNNNVNAINSFQGAGIQVYNNSMSNTATGVFFKRPSNGVTPNGCIMRNNVTFNIFQGFWLSFAGGGTDTFGHVNDVVYQNLLYNFDASGNGMEVDSNSNLAQNSGLHFYQNTIAEDVPNGYDIGNMTGAKIDSNVFLGSTSHIQTHFETASTVISQSDYNRFLAIGTTSEFELRRNSTPVSFNSLSGWKLAHTNNGSYTELTADPDQNSSACVLTDFPNRAARDYTYANGVGQGLGGINIGYDPTNIGPGW